MMRRRTLWFSLGLVAVVVVGLLAVIATPAFPRLVRALALSQIEAATGRAASIESLTLDLRRGTLAIRGFRLADRDGDTLATIGQLDARIRLAALLRGHVWLRDLAIADSTVRVVRLSHDEFNISDLIRRNENAGGRPLDVTVERFAISRGTVQAALCLLRPEAALCPQKQPYVSYAPRLRMTTRRWVERLDDDLGPSPHILHLGCGVRDPGRSPARVAKQLIRVDMSPVQIDRAWPAIPDGSLHLCGHV